VQRGAAAPSLVLDAVHGLAERPRVQRPAVVVTTSGRRPGGVRRHRHCRARWNHRAVEHRVKKLGPLGAGSSGY
jgi:hypothetical protein